jgi:hypothetical protein
MKTNGRWQMNRHPGDKYRYNEDTRILKDHMKRIKEETFETHLQVLTATALDTDSSRWKKPKG